MKYLSILLTFLICPFLSSEDTETITVQLETENKRLPIFIDITQNTSDMNASYLDKLQKVLSFDLNYNSFNYVVDENSKKNAFYVVNLNVKDKKLGGELITVNSNSSQTLPELLLSGDLATDRKQIHKLADLITKTLFQQDGIASTKILYTIKSGNPKQPKAEVFEADYDGENIRQITKENCLCVTPIYIPPKEGLASGSMMYVSYKTGQAKLFISALNESIGRRFSLLKGNQLMPTVSKQRDKVAFISDYTGNPDLFLQNFDPEKGLIGKPQQIFSTHLATQGTPTFSPDGKRIAFVSNKDGSPRIYMIDIPKPGTSLKNIKAILISKYNRDNTAPSWSPDGNKIAYCSNTQGTRQIWLFDFETGNERQLTFGGGHKENPSWAPNSTHLVFNSTGNQSSELFLINLNQKEAIQITKGSGEKRFPFWEPKN